MKAFDDVEAVIEQQGTGLNPAMGGERIKLDAEHQHCVASRRSEPDKQREAVGQAVRRERHGLARRVKSCCGRDEAFARRLVLAT